MNNATPRLLQSSIADAGVVMPKIRKATNLNSAAIRTYAECAEIMGVSDTRVKQLEFSALQKVRAGLIVHLKDYAPQTAIETEARQSLKRKRGRPASANPTKYQMSNRRCQERYRKKQHMKSIQERLQNAKTAAGLAVIEAQLWIDSQDGEADDLIPHLRNPINLAAIHSYQWSQYHGREHLYSVCSTLAEVEKLALKNL